MGVVEIGSYRVYIDTVVGSLGIKNIFGNDTSRWVVGERRPMHSLS